jgi:hypothetical protein
MSQSQRTPDGRTYWGGRPEDLAKICVGHAAQEGFVLELKPDTPVVPDEHFPDLGRVGTWGEIELLVRHLGDIGCSWVNLRFALDERGVALVRYEAKPSGEPLSDGGIPACNGGFDCHRLLTREEFERRHPSPAAPPT